MTEKGAQSPLLIAACAVLALAAALGLALLWWPGNEAPPNAAKQAPQLAQPQGRMEALHEKWRRAVEVYKARTEKDPRNHLDFTALGEACMALARATGEHLHFAPAEAALRRSLEIMPRENVQARVLLAGCLNARHRFKDALEFIAQSRLVEPEEKLFVALRGDALLALGEYDEAERAYNEFARIRPSPYAQTRQAQIAELRGNRKRARALMEEALKGLGEWEQESQAWVAVQLGLLDLGEGNLALARAGLEGALKWAPDYFFALVFLARCDEIEGRQKEARERLLRAAAISRAPEVLIPLARAEGALGNTATAELLRAEALMHFETHIKAGDQSHLRSYALTLIELQLKPTLALELCAQEAAARDDIYTSMALARARSVNGRHDDAVRALERALRLDTNEASLWLVAESVYRAAGDKAKAESALERARQINPLVKGQEAQWLAVWR